MICPTWPLQCWAMDLVGPLLTAPGNLHYAVIAVEYFTKWIEARALATITSATVQKFFWQQVVCRFGVPRDLTVDNGTQFDISAFKEFCLQIGTKLHFASVRHPQSNGLAERTNAIILEGIKKKFKDKPLGKWAEELIPVVWSHDTSDCRATGITPFKLLFGEEAVLPEELRHGSPRTTSEGTTQDEALDKDLLEDTRCLAVNNLHRYQAETQKWRDKKVEPRNLHEGDC